MPAELAPRVETAPLIAALGVSKRLGGLTILSSVDLAVAQGEIVTLIGPNGAGKTTLLRILLGLLPADTGAVRRRRDLRLGYMPQRMPLDDVLPLSVRRFLELGRPADSRTLEEVLEEVGAADVVASPIQSVSGGEFQRVLLARALLRDPELLVLDEPAQGVDIAGQEDLLSLILSIRQRRGCGVLMVSHDLHFVMSASDTVVCLNHHVCCTGHPETVSRDPAYLALFGVQAAGMLAPYTHHHDHAHDAAGRVVALEGGAQPGEAGSRNAGGRRGGGHGDG